MDFTVLKYAQIDKVQNINSNVCSFYLSQNYPNPFNNYTVIEFNLFKVSNVNLKIYNILGGEVATLVNENRNPGIYEITYNASSLSSGVYFYKLEFGGKSEVRKFMLVK